MLNLTMKKIKLTGKRGGYALIDNDDFEKVSKYKWNHSNTGYPTRFFIKEDGKYTRQCLHVFLMGTKKGFCLDHINRKRLDNRKDNLRFVTQSQSNMNKKLQSNNTSGTKGIYKTKFGWFVELWLEGKRQYLGHFKDKNNAIKVAETNRKEFQKEYYVK